MPLIGEYSEVAICNLALNELGRGGQITALDEASQSARTCKQRYPYARDALLRAYEWNFAGARKKLPAVTDAPPFEWEKAYQLPDDFLHLRSIYGGEGHKWAIEGKLLLCNILAPLPIKYTALVTSPTLFDPLFVAALATRIASEICVSITESTSRAEGLWQIYQAKLAEARKRDAMEAPPDGEFPQGSWLDSRRDWG